MKGAEFNTGWRLLDLNHYASSFTSSSVLVTPLGTCQSSPSSLPSLRWLTWGNLEVWGMINITSGSEICTRILRNPMINFLVTWESSWEWSGGFIAKTKQIILNDSASHGRYVVVSFILDIAISLKSYTWVMTFAGELWPDVAMNNGRAVNSEDTDKSWVRRVGGSTWSLKAWVWATIMFEETRRLPFSFEDGEEERQRPSGLYCYWWHSLGDHVPPS